jgi:predicted NAD/FAD-dependent oxidoreductase
MTEVAIIGAGLAGLTAARGLSEKAKVRIFEKSWRAGGRMSTRTGAYEFDHGAQYFTARTSAFNSFLAPFIEQGMIDRWDARFVELDNGTVISRRRWDHSYPHYVPVPGMNALCQAMAKDLDVHYKSRVGSIESDGSRWELLDADNQSLGSYDWVVTAIPAEQAAAIMPSKFSHHDEVRRKHMLPCYTLMLGFEQSPELDFDAALVKNAAISWISVNSSKPGRPAADFCLLAHSSNAWTANNLGLEDDSVIELMLKDLSEISGQDMPDVAHIDLHRWLYANIEKQAGDQVLIDVDNRLAAIGDWCIKGRVESSFISGRKLAVTCPL